MKEITFDTNGNNKQKAACQAWLDDAIRDILFGGAKYTGKSYLGAGLIFGDALLYPGTHYFIARHSLNDLRKYTKPTIYEVFDSWGLDHRVYLQYDGKDNFFTLYNDSKVFFIEAKRQPSDEDFHRFGSIQMTRGWIEEIGEIPAKAVEQLSLTVGRWKNKELELPGKVLMTCNPHKGLGFRDFYLPHKNGTLPPHRKFIQALPQDNRAGDQDYIDSIVNHPNKLIRERLGRGSWEYDDSPDILVDHDRILDAYTAEHVLEGPMSMTADIAFLGSDKFVIMIWSGWRLIKIHAMAKSDAKLVETTIKSLAEKHQVPRSRVVYDADGIGSFLDSYLKNARPFRNGSSPIGRDNYGHLKDQAGYWLARKFNKGEIWIQTEDHQDEVIEELGHLKSYSTDNDGKLKILPKKEIKKSLVRSPDFLDALIMRSFLDLGGGGAIGSSVPG